MTKLLQEKKYCSGCGACFSICPKNAIRMEEDNCGFSYPYVDFEKCVSCNLCKKVCSFSTNEINNKDFEFPVCFGAIHKNKRVIKNSRSGGAFSAISDWVLEKDGVVYGACLCEDFVTRHIRASTKQQRDLLRKSKYVQSDTNDSFNQVENDLKNGKWVLYSGTGCQCDGLRMFLLCKKIDISKLLLVDIICHGISSPKVLKDYLEFEEIKNKRKLKNFEFRTKDLFQ